MTIQQDCQTRLSNSAKSFNAQLLSLNQECAKNIARHVTKLNNETAPKLHEISSTLEKFHSQMHTCTRKVQAKVKTITNLNKKLSKLQTDAHQNVSRLMSEHDGVKQVLSRQLHNTRKDLTHYIGISHKIAKNYSMLNEEHNQCNEALELTNGQLDHWRKRVDECNNNFLIHHRNITLLNNTLSLYSELISVWQAKDRACKSNLDFCHRQESKSADIKRLRMAGNRAIQMHAKCLISKTGLLSNMSICQSKVIRHNELVHNLTKSHSYVKAALQSTQIKHKQCNSHLEHYTSNFQKCNTSLLLQRDKTETLERDLALVKTENIKLQAQVNTSYMLLSKFEADLQELRVINESSHTTTQTLLESEHELRNIIRSLEEKYETAVNMSNQLLTSNSYLKDNLTVCLSKSTQQLGNMTSLAQMQTYLNNSLWDSTKAVVECVQGISSLKNHTKPSLNLLKVVMVATNNIFVGNEVYNRYNSLAICNERLDYCRTTATKHKLQCLLSHNLLPAKKESLNQPHLSPKRTKPTISTTTKATEV